MINAYTLPESTFTTALPDQASVHGQETWVCDICGTSMLDLHCKLRCTNCGFMRDCSDP